MYTEILFIVTKKCKQHKGPSIFEKDKMWYIHTMQLLYYPARKRCEVLIIAVTYMKLENIKLNQRGQSQKVIYYMTDLSERSRKSKSIDII